MTKAEFISFCKDLAIYFERKSISPETLIQWFADVGNVPAEPLPWIAGKIKTLETFPKNLPGAVKKFWQDWLEANPDRQVKERELGCDGCWCGYLQASRFEQSLGGWYNTTFRCAVCKPRYPQSMTMATPEILLSQGWCKPLGYLTAWRYADCLPDHSKVSNSHTMVPRQNIGSMVDNIADGMTV